MLSNIEVSLYILLLASEMLQGVLEIDVQENHISIEFYNTDLIRNRNHEINEEIEVARVLQLRGAVLVNDYDKGNNSKLEI